MRGGMARLAAFWPVVALGLTPAAMAQPAPTAALADVSGMVGQEVRVLTITGALWPGRLMEATGDSLTIDGSSGAFTISRSAVRSVEALSGARVRPAMASGAAVPAGGELRIHGSNTVGAQMLPNLLEAYGRASRRASVQVTPGKVDEERRITLAGDEPGNALDVELRSHGTGTAFTSLASGAADLGMASRPVNDKERDAIKAAGMGDLRSVGQEHVIGLDGVSVIINKDNPVGSLTLAQLGAVFTGAVKDWSELGGPPGRIQVYSRDTKSGTYDTFKELVLHGKAMAPGARLFESSTELSDEVAGDPGGIGFIGLAYIREAKAVTVAQACGLTVTAEPFNVRTEEYPLSRRLFLYAPAPPARLATDFLTFASSAQAQPAVAASGFVNLMPEPATMAYSEFRKRTAPDLLANPGDDVAPARAQPIVQALRPLFSDARRLSITFRFQADSSALDTRGEADVSRLVAWSHEPANAGRGIVLVGYSSSVGSFTQNVTLSRERADALAKRLQAAGLRIVSTAGAGPVSPVACNTDARGQGLNRRVEVWVK